MWSDALGEVIKARSTKPFPMEFHKNSNDFKAIQRAVNQGIDAHLEAIQFTEFCGEYGRRGFKFSAETLHVLVRRLMNDTMQDEESSSESLASSICECLNIELV